MSLRKIPFDNCNDILSRFELSHETQAIISTELSPSEALETLQEPKYLLDFVNFMSHALPVREALTFGLSVINYDNQFSNISSEAMNSKGMEIWQEIRTWIILPDEQQRYKIGDLGESLGNDSALGWLCRAVFWNGSGSIVEQKLPVVLPQNYLHSKAIFGAIGLCIPQDIDIYDEFCNIVFALGMDIAHGAWPHLSEA